MSQPPLSVRLRYRVDNFLAKGSGSLFLALVVAFAGSIAVIAVLRLLLYVIWPDTSNGLVRQIWIVFLQLTDPGNMSQDNTTPIVFKLTAILAGFAGVGIFSALIAFITTALDQMIGELRKGRSQVLESGHTLILGWSSRVPEILRELILANESEPDAVVVVLAEREKEDMDEELRTRLPNRMTTRIVTRSGSPSSMRSLEQVSAHTAASAIILAGCNPSAPQEDRQASDARAIKAVLALLASAGPDPEIDVIAEVYDPRNRMVAEEVGPGRVSAIDTEEILAKIMVQTSRTSGLAIVYSELLSFDGSEIYFFDAPWKGATFGEAQYRFKDGVPIGIYTESGHITIRPDPDRRLESGDELIIAATDDSALAFSKSPVAKPTEFPLVRVRGKQRVERMLLLGWSPKAPTIISEFAGYVQEGSSVDVVLHSPPDFVREKVEALDLEIPSITVSLLDKQPLDASDLDDLNPFAYDHVMVLRQNPAVEHTPDRIDADSIVVLLHLRKLGDKVRRASLTTNTKIITEVMDSANQELINTAGVDDFLISDSLVSMILAQISQEPRLRHVYEDLFREDGSEMYVKPVHYYFDELPVTVRFADLMAVAQQREGEICLGYKIHMKRDDPDQNYGVVLVPSKKKKITLQEGDGLVVVAEGEG